MTSPTRRRTSPGRAPQRADTFLELQPLFEFSRLINSSLDLHFILNTLLLTLMGKMMVTKGMVLLGRERGWFEIVAAKGIDPKLVGHLLPLHKPQRSIASVETLRKVGKSWASFFAQHGQRLIIPIVVRKRLVGLVSLGSRVGKQRYARLEKDLMRLLIDLSATAIEKAVMIEELRVVNRTLDRKYQELNTLFDLSKEFNVGLDTERVVRLLTLALLGEVGVNRYAVCLLEDSKVAVASSRGVNPEMLQQAYAFCCELKTPSTVAALMRRKKYRHLAQELEHSHISAVIPMQVQNETKGIILLGPRVRGGEYGSADLEFLYSLANLAIISIENARLFQEALEKQRLEDELAIAREIQQGLLPRKLPAPEGFELAGLNVPSNQVGGDYYDVIDRGDSSYVLAIGDVSGKGTGAALLMANVQAALRTLAPLGLSLPDVTNRINALLCSNTAIDQYVTFFWGVLDVPTRTLRYVNAGHNPPFLLRADGRVERLDVGGIILGMMSSPSPYDEGCVTFDRGDLLVLFTDGVSEAMDSEGNDLTEERLESMLRDRMFSSASQVIDHVRREVLAFVGDTPQSDDMTLLAVRAV